MISAEKRQEIITRGQAARHLLSEPDFVLVVNALANETTHAMADTPIGPAGRDDREEHHLMLHGLKKVVDAVKQYAAALTNLEAMDELDTEPSETPEDY